MSIGESLRLRSKCKSKAPRSHNAHSVKRRGVSGLCLNPARSHAAARSPETPTGRGRKSPFARPLSCCRQGSAAAHRATPDNRLATPPASSATASRQLCGRPRRSVGLRHLIFGAPGRFRTCSWFSMDTALRSRKSEAIKQETAKGATHRRRFRVRAARLSKAPGVFARCGVDFCTGELQFSLLGRSL